MSMTLRKRLHISPFNAGLLPIVLPKPLLDKASDISFHAVQTFPERNFGYVELPDMEAEKLRKKLHGSTLKGAKMRVEEARPKKIVEGSETQDLESPNERLPGKRRKRREKEEGVVAGHELRDRKVKRGWTEPVGDVKKSKGKGAKKTKVKSSSHTGEAECLFKTKLPPTAAASGATEHGNVKKRKRGESIRDTVVHEFANTTKHAGFLRNEPGTDAKKAVVEYVEGQGWVDEDGNMVEAGPKRRRSVAKHDGSTAVELEGSRKPGSRRSSRLEAPSIQLSPPKQQPGSIVAANEETSSSGSSSSSSDSDNEFETSQILPSPPPKNPKSRGKRQGRKANGDEEIEVGQVERLSITRSSATPTPPPSRKSPSRSAPEVHPLEALFKRPNTAASHTPRKPNLEVSTSFSFFDPDVDEGENQGLAVPQTPFTQQDIRQRRQRSAAPTPDTAAPGKTFGKIWEGSSDISESGDDSGADVGTERHNKSATPEIKEEKPESEFSKWFWEHRGENNRAWKRRRREAAKEKRQKDNKERR